MRLVLSFLAALLASSVVFANPIIYRIEVDLDNQIAFIYGEQFQEDKEVKINGMSVTVLSASETEFQVEFLETAPGSDVFELEATVAEFTLGPTGPQGLPGMNGMDGMDGQDGANGAMGVQGVQGPPGPAGSGFRIVDSVGTEVGTPFDFQRVLRQDGSSTFSIQIDNFSGLSPEGDGSFYYQDASCSTDPYMSADQHLPRLAERTGTDPGFRYAAPPYVLFTPLSRDSGFGCSTSGGLFNTFYGTPTQVTLPAVVPPFNLAAP